MKTLPFITILVIAIGLFTACDSFTKKQPVTVVLQIEQYEKLGDVDSSFMHNVMVPDIHTLNKRLENIYGTDKVDITFSHRLGVLAVEVPYMEDTMMMKFALTAPGQLEFWETYENQDIADYFIEANEVIREHLGYNQTEEVQDTLTEEQEHYTLEELLSDESLVEDNRVDDYEEEYERMYPMSFKLVPNIVTTEEGYQRYGTGPIVGYAKMEDVATVNEYLALEPVRALFPKDLKLLWGAEPTEEGFFFLYAIKKMNPFEEEALLTHADVKVVYQAYDSYGEPILNIEFEQQVHNTWRRMTEKNIGLSIAVVIDGLVYTAPTVQGVIPDGRTEITGQFTASEARGLAAAISGGKLTMPLVVKAITTSNQ